MKATRSYVEQRFDYFNTLCFGGKLPKVPVRMSHAKGFLGQLRFRIKHHVFRSSEFCNFTLHVNSRFDLPQQVIDDTIIHEMIHLYIHFNRITDTAPHGEKFRAVMNAINHRHGRNISIRHTSTPEELDSDTHVKPHIICLSTLADGSRCVTVCARTRVFDIYRLLDSSPSVTRMEWFFSKDAYFNRFPSSKTAKLYRISDDDIDTYLMKNARRLKCDGHKITLD